MTVTQCLSEGSAETWRQPASQHTFRMWIRVSSHRPTALFIEYPVMKQIEKGPQEGHASPRSHPPQLQSRALPFRFSTTFNPW